MRVDNEQFDEKVHFVSQILSGVEDKIYSELDNGKCIISRKKVILLLIKIDLLSPTNKK
jgi:hypothetical protein